ncbi:MAG: cupin domain-containing protein [Desulfovibrionales bacterium]|nr:cupin domain-containing protein [Desulfovibrionales bacterium]
MGKRIVTEADIHKALDNGLKSINVNLSECIITPQAQDKAEAFGVSFVESSLDEAPQSSACSAAAPAGSAAGQGTGVDAVVDSIAALAAPVTPEPAPSSATAAPTVEAEVPASAGEANTPAALPTQQSAVSQEHASLERSKAEYIVLQVCALLHDKLPDGVTPEMLETIVRRVVFSRLGDATCSDAVPAASAPVVEGMTAGGVCFVERQRLEKQGASPVPVSEQVFIADAIGACDNAKLAGGYMEWERASFTRTVEAPEIAVVLDGELHLTVGGQTQIGKAGDMVYFPEGVELTYGTPTSVRIACVNNIQ